MYINKASYVLNMHVNHVQNLCFSPIGAKTIYSHVLLPQDINAEQRNQTLKVFTTFSEDFHKQNLAEVCALSTHRMFPRGFHKCNIPYIQQLINFND